MIFPGLVFAESSFDLSGKYKDYNVILIIADALRPDHLSCYGYPQKTSPELDLLAKQSVLFTNAFSQASLTLPSVVSIFTSLYPFSHGVRHILKDKVPQRIYTLAQILKIYGYHTAWFGRVNDPNTGRGYDVLKGFDEKFSLKSKKDIFNEDYSGIFNWVKRHRRENFFMTVHSYATHEAFFRFLIPNNKFTENISNNFMDFIKTMPEKSWENLQNELQNNQTPIYKVLGEKWVRKHKEYFLQPYSPERVDNILSLPETTLQQRCELIRRYSEVYFPVFKSYARVFLQDFLFLFDGAIFEFDKNLIGKLMSELKRLKINHKTIVIITADHGNEYYEHGNIGHGRLLYDESIHIPLIIYIPGLKESLKNDTLVESIDTLPTLLDLLGIPIPFQAQGISLVEIIEEKVDAPVNEFVFGQAISGILSIRSKEWKLITMPAKGAAADNAKEELFSLKEDKYEKINLIKKFPEITRDLRRRLNLKLHSLTSYKNEESEFLPSLDEATKERIRKTGYW